jgi:hypothetical protein
MVYALGRFNNVTWSNTMASTVKQREIYLDNLEDNAKQFVELCNTKACDAELPRKLSQAAAVGRNLIRNASELVEHVDMLADLLRKNSEVSS